MQKSQPPNCTSVRKCEGLPHTVTEIEERMKVVYPRLEVCIQLLAVDMVHHAGSLGSHGGIPLQPTTWETVRSLFTSRMKIVSCFSVHARFTKAQNRFRTKRKNGGREVTGLKHRNCLRPSFRPIFGRRVAIVRFGFGGPSHDGKGMKERKMPPTEAIQVGHDGLRSRLTGASNDDPERIR